MWAFNITSENANSWWVELAHLCVTSVCSMLLWQVYGQPWGTGQECVEVSGDNALPCEAWSRSGLGCGASWAMHTGMLQARTGLAQSLKGEAKVKSKGSPTVRIALSGRREGGLWYIITCMEDPGHS